MRMHGPSCLPPMETVGLQNATVADPTTPDRELWPLHCGARLRAAREALGQRAAAIEALLGLARGTLDRWERGDVDPGFGAVARLAREYAVSLDWIAGGARGRCDPRTAL